jgi:hypothetical protein
MMVTVRFHHKEDPVSARAWIFFLCLSSFVTAGAWAAASAHSAGLPRPVTLTLKEARVSLDLEDQVCRLLWLQTTGGEPAPGQIAGAARIVEARAR